VYNYNEDKTSSDVSGQDDLSPFMNEQGQLQVHDNEAAGGELAELQAVCIKLGLSYDHHNDAYYDCDASNEYVRNGKQLGYIFSTQTGQNLVSTDALQQEFGKGLSNLPHVDPSVVMHKIRKLAGLDIPDLEKFKVEEG
jgi:hypothetical protein